MQKSAVLMDFFVGNVLHLLAWKQTESIKPYKYKGGCMKSYKLEVYTGHYCVSSIRGYEIADIMEDIASILPEYVRRYSNKIWVVVTRYSDVNDRYGKILIS
jgi:hypothetical protein